MQVTGLSSTPQVETGGGSPAELEGVLVEDVWLEPVSPPQGLAGRGWSRRCPQEEGESRKPLGGCSGGQGTVLIQCLWRIPQALT